jgi:hypothetical protein
MKKIFYSWQSDNKPVRNKIKTALEIAAKRLNDQLEESERPELDSDTQGTYGSEDIINTIFEKIDACSIFVADVTPITQMGEKLIPNPNVMAELGYAIKAKGANTRLYIYCTDEPIDVSKMPFDIRGKSLFRFSTSDTPSAMADKLVPMLTGMLQGSPPNNLVKIELIDDPSGWANWSGKNGVQSGFRYHIGIDNFGGKADYISDIKIVAQDAHADPWTTTYYVFDGQRPNEKLKIEENEIKNIGAFLTDQPGQTSRLLPDLDRDTVRLVVTLRSSGKEISIPIPAGRLNNR